MLGQTRFDLTRFSLSAEIDVVYIEASLFDDIKSVAGAGVPVPYSCSMVAAFNPGRVRGSIAVRRTVNAEVALRAIAKMAANVVAVFTAITEIRQHINAVKDVKAAPEMFSLLEQSSWAGKTIPHSMELLDGLNSAAFASKNILTCLAVGGVLTAVSGAGKEAINTASILISIPPGGELRIDSETFRVLLDGVNILHAQKGDWVQLSRDLRYLDIESTTGGAMSGAITFQERWL